MGMGIILRSGIKSVKSVSVIAGSEVTGTRYEVYLGKVEGEKEYVVSVPNLKVSLATQYPKAIDYKLHERGLSSGDAVAIQEIVEEHLLPLLEKELI